MECVSDDGFESVSDMGINESLSSDSEERSGISGGTVSDNESKWVF